MGRMRQREIHVDLPAGEEIRLADAPCSELIKNLTISIVPRYMGAIIPSGGTQIAWDVFYGGGHDKLARTYAAPAPAVDPYQGGISQLNGTITQGTTALPLQLFLDPDILMSDRVNVGMNVKVEAGRARALWLRNQTTGLFNCTVMFVSETVGEAH